MVIKRITIKTKLIARSTFSLITEAFEVVMFEIFKKFEKLDSMIGFAVTSILKMRMYVKCCCEIEERKKHRPVNNYN